MKTIYTKPLTEAELADNDHKVDSDIIVNRVDYIWNYIADAYGNKIDYWWFNNANEGSCGSLAESCVGEWVFSEIKFDNCKNSMDTLLDGELWDLKSSLPRRWITEDFEDELEQAIASYEKRLSDIKAKTKKQKETIFKRQAMAIIEIESKLTKEELKLCFRADFKKIHKKVKK